MTRVEPLVVVYHGTPVNLSDIDVNGEKEITEEQFGLLRKALMPITYSGRINNMPELYAKIENPYIENVPYNKEWDIDDLVRKSTVLTVTMV